MKRKYFLRGMGLGIFVTALLFTIAALFTNSGMSDAQIINEAKKLGMVEASVESDQNSEGLSVEDEVKATEEAVSNKADKAKASEDENDKAKAKAEEEKAEANEEQAKAAEEQKAANQKKEEAAKEQEAAKQAKEAAKAAANQAAQDISASQASDSQSASSSGAALGSDVTFSVASGENSSTVSANLYKAGLVDDAGEFDRYLEQHNYDNYVQNGTFSIKQGSTYQEIANILTGR